MADNKVEFEVAPLRLEYRPAPTGDSITITMASLSVEDGKLLLEWVKKQETTTVTIKKKGL